MRLLDSKLIWEAYKNLYQESPDTVKDANNNQLFSWNSESQLTSPFMRIDGQWFLAGVNIFEHQPGGAVPPYHHAELFAKIIENEFLKVLPKKLKKFDYIEAYNEGDELAVTDFIESIIKSNKILTSIFNKYTDIDDRHEFLTLLSEEIANYVDPKVSAFRASKKYDAFSLPTIFYKPDIDKTRVWFDCGRLWLNPKSKEATIPGLIISMWQMPSQQEKSKIQTELASILKSKGYKFSHVAWDGDANIDPTQKHIKASKISVDKQPTWDDVKYGYE